MGVKKRYRDYNIVRNSWWKFWQIDELEFVLPTQYQDAYQEVEKKLVNGTQWSMELRSWVIEDIRQQLGIRVSTYLKLAKKSKSLKVRFGTNESGQRYYEQMNFYLRGESIYFDLDDAIKRENLLSKLGI